MGLTEVATCDEGSDCGVDVCTPGGDECGQSSSCEERSFNYVDTVCSEGGQAYERCSSGECAFTTHVCLEQRSGCGGATVSAPFPALGLGLLALFIRRR